MDHSITPPPELVEQWIKSARYKDFMPYPEGYEQYEQRLTTIAAQWGADQELEACCEWQNTFNYPNAGNLLRTARRSKMLSLKERALQAWAAVETGTDDQTSMAVIRRALEALPE